MIEKACRAKLNYSQEICDNINGERSKFKLGAMHDNLKIDFSQMIFMTTNTLKSQKPCLNTNQF